MKATIISVSALVLLSALAIAQTVAPPAPGGPPVVGADLPGGVNNPSRNDGPRFDLKFPGGNVREFVAAVTKALGKPVNVIIPKEAEATLIPPVDVFGVTVSALFEALGNASKRQVLVGSKRMPNAPDYREIGFNFFSQESGDSPEKVWTFQVIAPPQLAAEEPITAQRVVQYYPVAEYLSHFAVEDITTAIELGWQLQGGELAKNAAPILRFHEETKLLICAGSSQQLEIIPQVLAGLGQLLGYPRTDNLKITRKAEAIVIPRVEFREATVAEALDFMRKKALENDPEKKGINIVLNEVNGSADRRLTISLLDMPILDLLRFTAELSELDLQIRDTAIVLSTGRKTNSSVDAPLAGVRDNPANPRQTSPNPAGAFPPTQGLRGSPSSAQGPATGSFPGSRR